MKNKTIKGIPASGGKVKGVIKTYSEKVNFSSEDIMLAKNTTPDMCIEMINAKAIITENGGLLSHAAIFCREIKKPCIVGIKDSYNELKDGDMVEIDANLGTIDII